MTQRLRLVTAYGLLVAALGCGERAVPTAPDAPPPLQPTAATYDPTNAGTLTGRVTWAGAPPVVPLYEIRALTPADKPGQPRAVRANPNAPAVDPTTRGVAGAVVFLRGVTPDKTRPWDQPPVRVEQRDRRLHIVQGDTDTRVGFVRVGAAVEMVSREDRFHCLHADGAAYFTLTFPDPDRVRQRRLTAPGLVELSSAAGYYWMRAYLFVAEHPYYARTDAQGRFRLAGVPPGRYELVCWHPSWLEAQHSRDPETSLVTRVAFRPPVEKRQQIEIGPRGSATATFILSLVDFEMPHGSTPE